MRKLRADILNKRGRLLKPIKVGDHVKNYVPPSHGEAVHRRRKAKHICQWRGPLVVTRKLSNTTFELVSYFNETKTFRRHISNIRRWRGPLPAANDDENLILPFVSDVEVGEFILVIDSPTALVVYLARVTSVDDTTIGLSAWGSTNLKQHTSVFRPVMILDENKLPTTAPRKGKKCKPWTWEMLCVAVPECVLARDLVVLPSGKLGPQARITMRTLPKKFSMRRFRS